MNKILVNDSEEMSGVSGGLFSKKRGYSTPGMASNNPEPSQKIVKNIIFVTNSNIFSWNHAVPFISSASFHSGDPAKIPAKGHRFR